MKYKNYTYVIIKRMLYIYISLCIRMQKFKYKPKDYFKKVFILFFLVINNLDI